MEKEADLAIVVGGYNSSNTTHLVELLEQKFKTYFIRSAEEIKNANEIEHFDIHLKKVVTDYTFLPSEEKALKIVITSGASCPDSIVDRVLQKILDLLSVDKTIEEVLKIAQ
jgi:4-hydroxy-3-methylbut-2-enyl diphosphate reductase